MTTIATDKSLQEHLFYLLNGDGAHVDFDTAVKDLPANLRGKKPRGATHSPWEVLEHLRICLWDVLEFLRNPMHVSPEFPAGYWPATQHPPDEKAWEGSVESFRTDLKALQDLVAGRSAELLKSLPHAEGQTILRKVMMIADHNAYHLGELVLLRRLLGAWE